MLLFLANKVVEIVFRNEAFVQTRSYRCCKNVSFVRTKPINDELNHRHGNHIVSELIDFENQRLHPTGHRRVFQIQQRFYDQPLDSCELSRPSVSAKLRHETIFALAASDHCLQSHSRR